MYRVQLERIAEKDLARLTSEIHDCVIAAIQVIASSPRPPGCRKLAGSKHDWRIRVGDYLWFMKSPTRLASCGSTACATAGKFIADSQGGSVGVAPATLNSNSSNTLPHATLETVKTIPVGLLEAVVERLKAEFQPERIFLFGSHA